MTYVKIYDVSYLLVENRFQNIICHRTNRSMVLLGEAKGRCVDGGLFIVGTGGRSPMRRWRLSAVRVHPQATGDGPSRVTTFMLPTYNTLVFR